jgi:hypothetical protein
MVKIDRLERATPTPGRVVAGLLTGPCLQAQEGRALS